VTGTLGNGKDAPKPVINWPAASRLGGSTPACLPRTAPAAGLGGADEASSAKRIGPKGQGGTSAPLLYLQG
jgi:hypothetical protein